MDACPTLIMVGAQRYTLPMTAPSPISLMPRPAQPTALPQPLLRSMVDRFHPEAVILFGSRARGDHRPDSDWDVLVVVDDDTPEGVFDPEYCWQAQRNVVPGVHAEVIPTTLSDFLAERTGIATVAHEAFQHGILVYERHSAG